MKQAYFYSPINVIEKFGYRGDARSAAAPQLGVVQPLRSLLQENKSRVDPEEG